MKFINELKKLNLPTEHYVLFGSAPLAIRNLRENNDLDILVSDELWQKLLIKFSTHFHNNPPSLKIGNLEIFNTWIDFGVEKTILIKDAEFIDDLPFVKLKYFLLWKKKMNREKDKLDIKLSETYLGNHR